MHRIDATMWGLLLALLPLTVQAAALRICSDPNNLPFSNRAGDGFEDKIARMAAQSLGDTLEYTYAVQIGKFVKRTLGANRCDAMMGVPAASQEVDTTRPYYVSTYVFVSRRSDHLGLTSLADPRLRKLKIGVHLIGGDSTPPELALGQEGIVDNVEGFMIEGDLAKPNPPARLIEAVETGKVDVAAAWGPLAGYFSRRSPVALDVSRVTDTARFAPLQFAFPIALGVRKGDDLLRRRLDAFVAAEQPAIRKILVDYGIPLVDMQEDSHE